MSYAQLLARHAPGSLRSFPRHTVSQILGRLICAKPCEAPCRDACVDVFNMHKTCEAIQCLMPWCLAHQGRLHQHLCRSWSSQRIMHSWSVRYESAWRRTDSAGELTHLRRLKRVGEWPLEHPRHSSGTLHSAPNSIGIRALRLVLMECLANPPDSCPNKTPYMLLHAPLHCAVQQERPASYAWLYELPVPNPNYCSR